jgi:hypothetical protein
MVGLVQTGRSPEESVREFEPTAQSIRNWVAQAKRDTGRGDRGLLERFPCLSIAEIEPSPTPIQRRS